MPLMKTATIVSVPNVRFKVTVKPGEDGWWVVECPSLPGCVSQGKTKAEALKNIREAIAGWLESFKAHPEIWGNGSP